MQKVLWSCTVGLESVFQTGAFSPQALESGVESAAVSGLPRRELRQLAGGRDHGGGALHVRRPAPTHARCSEGRANRISHTVWTPKASDTIVGLLYVPGALFRPQMCLVHVFSRRQSCRHGVGGGSWGGCSSCGIPGLGALAAAPLSPTSGVEEVRQKRRLARVRK